MVRCFFFSEIRGFLTKIGIILVSPYLKTLSMVASTKLLHLLEAFSTPWFLFSSPTNHHLVFFLLEIFNNIIQYQFDGNSNLVYTIIRKRQVFHALANLPCDYGAITKSLSKRGGSVRARPSVPISLPTATSHESIAEELAMEGSHPAQPAEPGTLKATLPDTPGIGQMTERESAHPQTPTGATYNATADLISTGTTITTMTNQQQQQITNGVNKIQITENSSDLSAEVSYT